MPVSSQRAIDMIVAFEVTSEAAYNLKYRRPIWPGVQSGITIGIGYDVGYVSVPEFQQVWGPKLPNDMIAAMIPCIGKKGQAARALLSQVRNLVSVEWEAAKAVFKTNTLPKYETMVRNALPNDESLSADCFGALTSLTFNRGASFAKAKDPNDPVDRFREMRAIKRHMTSGELALIPPEIRAMQRIWPTVAGLQRRRREEASLFQLGLS